MMTWYALFPIHLQRVSASEQAVISIKIRNLELECTVNALGGWSPSAPVERTLPDSLAMRWWRELRHG